MKIKVTRTFVLDVSEDLELENFKALCKMGSGFPASEIAIIARGQPLLENKKSLKDLGLQEGDEVILEEAGRRPENAPNMPLFGLDFSSIQVPGIAGASANVPVKTIADPAVVKEMFMSNTEASLLKQNNPRPADALLSGNLDMLRQQIAEKMDREKQRMKIFHASPLDTKAQWMIAEEIRQNNIETNLTAAIQYNSETFGTVVIICKVNGHFVKAFVDLSAQTTMMSAAAAKRCKIMRLVDHKCAGVAKGVGIRKITGRIHTVQIQIEDVFLASSFSVMEQLPMDMLLGLDMLRRHQCTIDLRENCLHIGTTNTRTTFLTESELPECARLTVSSPEALKIKEALERSKRDLASTRGSGGASTSNETVTAQASDKFTEKDVAELMKLGFARDQVIVELRAFNGDNTQATAALFGKDQPIGISILQLCDSSLNCRNQLKANKDRAVEWLMSLQRVKNDLSDKQKLVIFNRVGSVNCQLVRNYNNAGRSPTRMYANFSTWFQSPFKLPAAFLVPQDSPPTEEQLHNPPIAADFDALTIEPSTSDLGALPASLVPPTELQDAANDVGLDAIEERIPNSSSATGWSKTIKYTMLNSQAEAATGPIPEGEGWAVKLKGYDVFFIKRDGLSVHVAKKFIRLMGPGEMRISGAWIPGKPVKRLKHQRWKPKPKQIGKCQRQKWSSLSKEQKKQLLLTAALTLIRYRVNSLYVIRNYLRRRYDINEKQLTSAINSAKNEGDDVLDPNWRQANKPVKRLHRKRPLRRPTKKLFDWNIASKQQKTRIMLCAIKAYGSKEKLTKCINNYALNCTVKDIDNMVADMCLEDLAQEKWCHDRKLLLWSLTSKGKEQLGKRYTRYLQDDEEFFYRQFNQIQGAKGQTVDPENIVLNIQDEKKPHLPLSASKVKAWMGKMKGKGTLLRDSSKHGIKYESHGLEKLAELYPDSNMDTKKLVLRHKHLTAIPDAVMKVKKVDPVTGEIIEYDAFVEIKSPLSAVPSHDNKEKTFVERLLSLSYMELVQTGDGKWTFRLDRKSAHYAQIMGQLHASDPDAARDGKKVTYKKVDHAIFAVFIPILDPTTGRWTGKYELYVEELERDQKFIDNQLVPTCLDYLEHGPSKKVKK